MAFVSKLLLLAPSFSTTNFLICIFLVLLFVLSTISILKQRSVSFLPGPVPLPIIGNVHQIAPQIHRFVLWLGDLLEEYNGTASLWVINNNSIATKDVNLIQSYYQSPQANDNFKKDTFRATASYGLGEGLLTSAGPHWTFARKALAPSFAPALLKKFVTNFENHASCFVKNLEDRADDKPFPILFDIVLNTFYNISDTFLQVSKEDLRDPKDVLTSVEIMMGLLQDRGFSPWQHPDGLYHLLPSGKLALKTMNSLTSYLKNIRDIAVLKMEENKKDDANAWKNKIFINTLLRNEGFSEKDILDEIATIILAGYETTANALGFTFLVLGLHPEVQERIYEEDALIQQEMGDRDLEAGDLSKYTYLDQVIKESLRIFPVVPVFHRRLTEKLPYGKDFIPAGSELLIHSLSVHRDPVHYPDPLKFDPDRFLPENVAQRHPYAYLPFSMGGRMCLGWRFSSMQMKIFISSLIRKYKIYSDTPIDKIKIKMEVTLKDEDHYVVRLEKR